MRIDCYRNLNKSRKNPALHVWSLRHRGKVIAHYETVFMVGCSFVVGEKARQTAVRKKCRSVHAMVRGELSAPLDDFAFDGEWTRVSYNPFKGPHFYVVETGEKVTHAHAVWFRADGCFIRREA